LKRILAIAVTALMLLAGCSFEPRKEPLATAIPSALLASDLGILEAEASTGMDGFVKYLSVFVVLDHDTVSQDELVRIITISVENSDESNIEVLHIGARDGTVEGYEYIDVGSVGVRLGFERAATVPDIAKIGWESAVALADEEEGHQ
jgi:hypothetical protein